MKRIFAFLIVAFYLSIAVAAPAWFPEGIQTKGSSTIGEKSTAAASSVLDVRSTTKGMLTPRMTTSQRTSISTPATGLLVYDTDTKTFWQYNATSWVEVGSGGGGGRNYLEANPDAETDTTGWVTYADAAGSTPVDGTGGSPASTWDRTTLDPLAETGSFLFTKSAANRQGEGVSFDFTIEREDRGKVLQIDYTFEIPSGTYATGDLAWYIFDVTNSRLIQPSAYQVEKVGISSHAQPLTFQTSSDSTSYRLILHVATTSASAYTAKFDSLKIGPQNQAQGPPVTNWTAYTPTVSALSGTLTNFTVTGYWRQTGDTADYRIKLVFNGAVGTWSQPIFSLPTGHTVDVTKIPGGSTDFRNYARGRLVDSSPGNNYEASSLLYTTTQVLVQYPNVASHTGAAPIVPGAITQLVPFTWATTDAIDIEFNRVPIVGWSSNTVVSSSANTRPVVVTANAPNAGSHSSETIIAFTELTDSHGAFSSNTFTAPIPGWYQFDVGALTGSFASSSTGAIQLGYKISGGSNTRFAWTTNNGATTNFWVGGSSTVYLTAGQTLAFYSTSTSTISYSQGLMSIRKVDGPAQISSGSIVALAVKKTTGVHNSTGNTIDVASWDAVTGDTFSAFNTTTGIYTIPAPGWYHIIGTANFSTAATSTQVVISIDGSTDYIGYSTVAASGTNLQTSAIYYLTTGQTVKLRAFQNSGGNANYSSTAWANKLMIIRHGGVN